MLSPNNQSRRDFSSFLEETGYERVDSRNAYYDEKGKTIAWSSTDTIRQYYEDYEGGNVSSGVFPTEAFDISESSNRTSSNGIKAYSAQLRGAEKYINPVAELGPNNQSRKEFSSFIERTGYERVDRRNAYWQGDTPVAWFSDLSDMRQVYSDIGAVTDDGINIYPISEVNLGTAITRRRGSLVSHQGKLKEGALSLSGFAAPISLKERTLTTCRFFSDHKASKIKPVIVDGRVPDRGFTIRSTPQRDNITQEMMKWIAMDRYDDCPVTGFPGDWCDAAHPDPQRKNKAEEGNIFLFAPHIHRLYDRGMFTVTLYGEILFEDPDMEHWLCGTTNVKVYPDQAEFLQWHMEKHGYA